MPSSIAWLDFSDHDRRRMIELIRTFREHETRDELGIGSVRDAFAEILFPGTSTLQTRARYYLFVPWLYRSYEDDRLPSDKIAGRLRREELGLMEALKASRDRDGIIGINAGAGLQRFPSSIYWNGLRRWQILNFPGSQDTYHRTLDSFYEYQKGRVVTDDREPVEGKVHTNWNANLPDPPPDFPRKATLRLTGEEAAYLRERLFFSCPDSLLAFLIDRRISPARADFPWCHPQAGDFSPRLQEYLSHAQNFSEVMHGATLLYNLMLAELWPKEKLIEEYRDSLHSWRKQIMKRQHILVRWDRTAFWKLANGAGNIPMLTWRFVNDWLDLILSTKDVPRIEKEQSVRKKIKERETKLKGNRSRLTNRRYLELWGGSAGSRQIDYRWSVARRIISDILKGLES